MADGYSKFKSRSIDYSDLSSLPHSLRFNAALTNPNTRHSDQKTTHRPRDPPHARLPEEDDDEEEDEHRGGAAITTAAALSRNCSVSASTSGFQSAVKRAMSMRRSSSVAERYCRIHDQFATIASLIDDDEMEGRKTGGSVRMNNAKKKNAAGKIVRACKRFFGL